jgi:hypothetical protein
MSNTDNDSLLKKWNKELPIKKWLFMSDDYIVFINKQNNEIDWKIEDKVTDGLTEEENKRFNEMLALEEEIAIKNVNINKEKINNTFYELLGSGLVRIFEHEYDTAEKALRKAENYIIDRNYEITRLWRLQATLVTAAIFASLGFILIALHKNDDIVKTAGYSLCGALGVLLSTFMNLDKMNSTVETGRGNIYFESSVRVCIGVLMSFIGILAIKFDIVLSFLNKIKTGNIEILYAILIAPSQHFIPNLFAKFDNSGEKNDK